MERKDDAAYLWGNSICSGSSCRCFVLVRILFKL